MEWWSPFLGGGREAARLRDAASTLVRGCGRCSAVCSSLKSLVVCLEIGNVGERRSEKQKPRALPRKGLELELKEGVMSL